LKRCFRCDESKDDSEFTKNKRTKDGLAVYCIPCNREAQRVWYERRYGITHELKRLRAVADPMERFERQHVKVPISGCWIWLGHETGSNRYGTLRVDNKQVMAHRFSYERHIGPVGDLQVLHRCDTPLCVNPHHLFLGTNQDNVDDRQAKGRQARGAALRAAQLIGWERRKKHEQV
jgi:hypothetical protein